MDVESGAPGIAGDTPVMTCEFPGCIGSVIENACDHLIVELARGEEDDDVLCRSTADARS